jgi:hypothetical protein
MSQANAGNSRIPSTDPTPSEIDDMIDGLDAVDPRPPLSDYEAWLAEGIEVAAEVRAFEQSRSALMRAIYGDCIGEAA